MLLKGFWRLLRYKTKTIDYKLSLTVYFVARLYDYANPNEKTFDNAESPFQ